MRYSVLMLGFMLLVPCSVIAQWGMSFEYVGKDTIAYPYDGKPKAVIRIINTTGLQSPTLLMTFSSPDYPNAGGGFATFPNGGFITLAPNETTYASIWTSGVWEQSPPPGYFSRDFDFKFARQFNADTSSYTIRKRVVFNNLGQMTKPSGPMTFSGTILLQPNIPTGGLTLEVATPATQWYRVDLSIQQQSNKATFSTSLPARDDWYVKIKSDDYQSEFFKLTGGSTSNLEIPLQMKDTSVSINYNLTKTVITPTGFWRGAASESEQTVALFPGQENWKRTGNKVVDSTLMATGKLYKYTFAATLVWEHAPGWEIWGGDMSPDGRYIAYALNPTFFDFRRPTSFKLVLLDGRTGQILWQKVGPTGGSGKIYEALEVSLSNNGNYVAVGTTASGQVTLLETSTGNVLWTVPSLPQESFGQVRKLAFDGTDTYLYAGSGDNYLRKLKVSDGSLQWRAFIGGWPFVNGLGFSSNGAYIVTGTKSFDATIVRATDGKVMWRRETQSLDAVFSPDGSLVAAFNGLILNSSNGEIVGMSNRYATSHFSKDNSLVFKIDRDVSVFDLAGNQLYSSPPSDIGIRSGEQVQWSYVSKDNQTVIVAARDMANPPQIGIAFYTGSIISTPKAAAPNAPLPLIPENNATGISRTPRFFWNSSKGAASYQLQVSINSNFSPPEIDTLVVADTSFAVSQLKPLTSQMKYYWRVAAKNASGTSPWSSREFTTSNLITDVPEIVSSIPTGFALGQNYPNPFNPSTSIRFAIPARSLVTLDVHNIVGQQISRLVSDELGVGWHEARWEADVASGVYFYRISARPLNQSMEPFRQTRKMVLMR